MVTLDSLAGLSSTQSQQNLHRANQKVQTAINSLVTGTKNRAGDAVAELATATRLQTQIAGLRQISNNLAQSSSLAQVADAGAEQIQERLLQLQSLATQANSPVLNEANRKALNDQFKQGLADIDRIAQNTSFNGRKLLDGSLSGDNALSLNASLGIEPGDGDEALSIEAQTPEKLFSGQKPDLLSADNAARAFETVGAALNKVIGTRSEVGSFQKSVDFAAASIASAVANQEAAQSILSDADFAETSTGFSLANIQRNATIALAAQGNRLNPALVGLLIK